MFLGRGYSVGLEGTEALVGGGGGFGVSGLGFRGLECRMYRD